MKKIVLLLFMYSSLLLAQSTGIDSSYIKKQMTLNEENKKETLDYLKKNTPTGLNEVVKKFDYKAVPNTNTGWYHHKIKKDTSACWFEAPVSVNGHIYLKARYTGTQQYNMNRIAIKIEGHGSFNSKPLALNSNYIFRRKHGNKVSEAIHFLIYKTRNGYDMRDVNCVAAIVFAEENEKVSIVFYGEMENYEVTLTKENIKAIKESWELSQYLCYKNNDYSTFTTNLHFFDRPSLVTMLIPMKPYTADDMKGLEKF
jgi:hypothetical protein